MQKLRKETFGIILPDGWLGRPYDNQHHVKGLVVTNNIFTIVFDDIREIKIENPKAYEFSKIEPNWSSLKFLSCQEITLKWIPFGEEKTGNFSIRSYRLESGNTLEIVGYFHQMP